MVDGKCMKATLQRLVLSSDIPGIVPDVYYHLCEDGLTEDYDGYYNLLYIEKRKRYTDIEGISLVLMLKGYAAVTIMHNRDEVMKYRISGEEAVPDKDAEAVVNEEKPTYQTMHGRECIDGVYEYRFMLPYDQYEDGVFWFKLHRTGSGAPAHMVNQISGDNYGANIKEKTDIPDTYVRGYYEGEISALRSVGLYVDICTYKREKYVLRNLRRIVAFLSDDKNAYIRNHIHIGLIDNGKTLKKDKRIKDLICTYPNIEIVENKNTGGAGGFTRGMCEAIAYKETLGLTHVLLMDDDASYDCELLVRLFGVLRTLKDEYADITVGGAIWREDYPFIQHASGEWFEGMSLENTMPCMDMRSYEECTQEEMCTTANEYRRYSGWWCCCYSMNVVREDNLPLQVFIHGDDIEYEKRDRQSGNPVVFFNGIGVWHREFDSEYAGVKRYYDARNYMILTVRHEPWLSKRYIRHKIGKMLLMRYLTRNYVELELSYMGAMDFLRGRKWLMALDPEENHKRITAFYKENTSFAPVEEIDVRNKSEVINAIGADRGDTDVRSHRDMYDKDGTTATGKIDLDRLLKMRFIRPKPMESILMCIRNGMLGLHKRGAALTTPDERFWAMDRHYKHTVLYVPDTGKAMLVKPEIKKFFRVIKMYISFSRGLRKYDIEEWRK